MQGIVKEWMPPLLEAVRKEFEKPTPSWKWEPWSQDDEAYVQQICNNPSSFGSDAFIKECLAKPVSLTKKKAVSGPVSFLIVAPGPLTIPLGLWFRIVRTLVPKRSVRVVLFGNPRIREPPKHGQPIEPIHVNGGYTNRCSTRTIVIYRAEEATRVLIHELFHGSCSDPSLAIPYLEADTEAWAEIVYCAFMGQGKKDAFLQRMREQIRYAVSQAEWVRKHHKVEDARAYGWRYLTGRIRVWERLGFAIPSVGTIYKDQYKSLRLTYADIPAKQVRVE